MLDVVEVPVTGRVANDLQPENWGITGENTWTLVRRARFAELANLVESPENIWGEPRARNDSISEEYLRLHPVAQSLYLVAPTALRVQFFTNDYGRRKRRAVFEYRNQIYDLALTDPSAPGNYNARYPQLPDFRERILGAGCLLCVSLAHDAFRGRHYKLVATILDPDHLR